MSSATVSGYIRDSISNGNAREQALIRRWWYENHGGRGRIVWEYFLAPCYADAVLFPSISRPGVEETGQMAVTRFPVKGQGIVLCEAKIRLTPQLIGQALVHAILAKRAGAEVVETVILSEFSDQQLADIAKEMGLRVSVKPL